MELTEMVAHQAPELALVAPLTTLPVAMEQRRDHVAQHQTGAAAVVVAQQLLAQRLSAVAVMEVQVVRLPSQEQASRSLAVVVAAVVTAATQATLLPRAATAEQVAAVTVVHQHGMDPAVLQALASAAPSILVAVVVAVAIALAPKSLEVITAVAATVDPESLSCAISYLPFPFPIWTADQTLVRHQPTTSRETKPSRLQVMHP
jgi:hypothetical protein